jgi:hypothetical protein
MIWDKLGHDLTGTATPEAGRRKGIGKYPERETLRALFGGIESMSYVQRLRSYL